MLPARAWTSTAFSCPTSRDCAVGALVGAPNSEGVPSFIRPTAVVLTTRDGGRSWLLHRLPASAGSVRGLDCRTIEFCIALTWTSSATQVDGMSWDDGADAVFPAELYTTNDAGASWASVRLPSAPAGDVYTLGSLACTFGARCILTGRRVHVEAVPGAYTSSRHADDYRSTDAKAVVVIVDTRARNSTVEVHSAGPVSCDSDRCLMVTGPGTSHHLVPHVFASTDGGRSWSGVAAHGLPAFPLSLQCASATSCLTTTGSTTNDGGKNWTGTERNMVAVSWSTSGSCVGLRWSQVRDPLLAPGQPTIPETRVVTNAPG